MTESSRSPYLDASVFISWLVGEVCDGVDRGEIVREILEEAGRGTYAIYTSNLTLAEVHHRRHGPRLTQDQDEETLSFFEHDFIHLIDVDRRAGEQANRLCRELGLRPNDGIHLASALRAGCDVLLTWDTRLTRVVHPDIRVELPRVSQLPLGLDREPEDQ